MTLRSLKLLRLQLSALLLGSLLLVSKSAIAQDFIWAPDFPVGASIPSISSQDQNGDIKTFDQMKGEKGLLFMLSRSFDW